MVKIIPLENSHFRFIAKIWSFLVKNALFGPFLPNAIKFFPDFCHRNLLFGLLKNGENNFHGKILGFNFLVKIWPFLVKIWPFLAKNARFGLFLSNATINVPHFHHRNIFFGLLKNGAIFFGGEILKIAFWGVF